MSAEPVAEPRVTGVVARRLGVDRNRTFYALEGHSPFGLGWQVACPHDSPELRIGSTVAVYGFVPAEDVIYADRIIEVKPPDPGHE